MFTIMFNMFITDLAYFDGYARAATLITDILRIAVTEIMNVIPATHPVITQNIKECVVVF